MSQMKKAMIVAETLHNLAMQIEELVCGLENVQPEVEVGEAEDVVESTISLEEVRAVLADKNRDGHREKVKAIIEKYGANKLTELDPKHYSKVLEEVGELI